MNKILVLVYIPEIEQEYDVYIPINKKIGTIKKYLISSVEEFNDGNVSNIENFKIYDKIIIIKGISLFLLLAFIISYIDIIASTIASILNGKPPIKSIGIITKHITISLITLVFIFFTSYHISIILYLISFAKLNLIIFSFISFLYSFFIVDYHYYYK